MARKILVSGACGYIGSHTLVVLAEAGYDLVAVDNLYNSKAAVLDRVEQICGVRPPFYPVDCCDRDALTEVFEAERPDAVIHFAGYKAVGESVAEPLKYYRNNLDSTLTLLEVMEKTACRCFIFSSSATVYGIPESVPLQEDSPLSCTNPYGWTKYMNERILLDYAAVHPDFSLVLLRYFNPVGAHPSGLIGEDPKGIPNNLMPYITQVAVGKRPYLAVFGSDYPTVDGTGVRDYIHVQDLAEGHAAALRYAFTHPGSLAVNLGTGRGYSVLEMVHAFEKVNGVPVPVKMEGRRAGDVAEMYADPTLAREKLGWTAKLGLEAMMRDSWNWQKQNPNGYADL